MIMEYTQNLFLTIQAPTLPDSGRVLGTVMGEVNTSPNHVTNSCYRNPAFYFF